MSKQAAGTLAFWLCATCLCGGERMRDDSDMKLAEKIVVGGTEFRTAAPPKGLVLRAELGLVTHEAVTGQVVHRTPRPQVGLYETRATITPGGDYLLMFPQGRHYAGQKTKANDLLACRSSDKGKTWSPAKVAFAIDYNQHGFIPLIPRGSKRLYAFGTQPLWNKFNGVENAAIGYRYSDDDGQTWSPVSLIEPANDPGYLGMSVMRMCETDAGTWLLGTHTGTRWFKLPDGTMTTKTRSYILRSEDQGKTWTLLPGPREEGWYLKELERMDEIRPIALGGGKVLAFARTCEGHLWELRSGDDGRTWSDPRATVLVHPDAPPMVFHLADGETLIAFHHNRHTGHHFKQTDRSEVWVSLSTDEGRTWSEPRFVFANALAPTLENDWRNHNCSYVDMFPDGETLHLFVPHRWRQALHLTFREGDIANFPTKADLASASQKEGAQ